MPMAEANYHPKVPTLQSAHGRIKLGMGPRTVPVRSPQEQARMLAIPENPGVAGAAANRDGSRSCACEGAYMAGWKSPSGRSITGL